MADREQRLRKLVAELGPYAEVLRKWTAADRRRGNLGTWGPVLGEAVVVRVHPPVRDGPGEYEYVYISESTVMGEPETYAFPSNAQGKVPNYTELPISQKGFTDWRRVLREAGYMVRDNG